MIELHFDWHWLLMAVLIIVGLSILAYYAHDDHDGIGAGIRTTFGCLIFIMFCLIALVIGGIFIW